MYKGKASNLTFMVFLHLFESYSIIVVDEKENTNRYEVVGITSYGLKCANPNFGGYNSPCFSELLCFNKRY